MVVSLGFFKGFIITSIAGAAVLMVLIVGYFIYELKKNEIW